MIAALPRSLFGLIQPTMAPMQDASMGGPAAMPAAAYVNGPGGARLTADMIAQRGKGAQALMASGMDASPVGHWTQGLARVAQSLVGNMQQGDLDKMSARNAADSQAALASLGTGGSEQSIAAILGNPYLDEGVKDVAKLQWQATHRPPPQPTEFERMVTAAGYTPGTPEYAAVMRQGVENKVNPMQAVPGVDEQGNQILRFIRPTGLSQGGGDPTSVAPGMSSPSSPALPTAPVGKLTPIGGAGSGPQTFR